jgi:hypothetical protein
MFEVAGRIANESTLAASCIVAPRGVAKKRIIPVGRVEVPGCVAKEGIITVGRVKVGLRNATECIITDGRVIAARNVTFAKVLRVCAHWLPVSEGSFRITSTRARGVLTVIIRERTLSDFDALVMPFRYALAVRHSSYEGSDPNGIRNPFLHLMNSRVFCGDLRQSAR